MKKAGFRILLGSCVALFLFFTGTSFADEQFIVPYSDGRTGNLAEVPTGSEVSYTSGTYHFSETDLRVSAKSIPMVWERTYRSNRVIMRDKVWVFGEPLDGPLGFGWTTPWFARIEGDAYVNGEGRYFYFEKDSNGSYIPNMKAGLLLNKTANGYELRKRGENTYIFNTIGKLISIKDPAGNTVALTYDVENKLTSIKDVMGRTIFTFAYNAGGRISGVTDIAGRTMTYEYDAIGNLIKVKYGTQVISEYTCNSYHGLTSKGNALNETYTVEYQYPDRGIVKRIIDPVGTEMIRTGQQPAGHEMTFIYDFKNRVFYYTDYRGVTYKNITDPEAQVLSVEEIVGGVVTPIKKVENIGGRTYKTIDALGNDTIEQRDEWDNTIKKTDAEGNEWRYSYNNQGKLLSITDPMGTITKYEYDTYGNRTKETVAAATTEESITTYTYDQYNELASMIRGNATTNYSYNNAGNLTEIKDPMGSRTTMTYDSAGNLLTRTQPLIGTTTYENYDFRGNPGKVTDPNGNVTLYTYDALGRAKTITTQTDNATTEYSYVTTSGTCPSCGSGGGTGSISAIIPPEGNRTDYNYNGAGDLIKTTDNDGNTLTYAYDHRGNKVKEETRDNTGTLQRTFSYEYDLLNRPVKAINPDYSYIIYGYDYRGNRTSIKNPNGSTTFNMYDALNRLTKVIQPGNIVTSYTYDKRGNLTSVTDANGNATTYEYDSQNRQTKTMSADTGTTTNTFDLNENLKTKTDANGIIITYNYDVANRLTNIVFPETAQNITYTYDTCPNGKGRLCVMTDPSGTTNYEYDGKGQVAKETKVIDNITYMTEYGYDRNKNLKTMKYPSGKVITYNYSNDRVINVLKDTDTIASNIEYKPFGGLSSITYGNNLQQEIGYDQRFRITSIQTGTVQNLTYAYDYNGNITGIMNTLDNTKNKTYTYDALDRLTGAVGPWGTLNYSYDGVGNRQTESTGAGVTNYEYNANRLMGSAGGKVFTFGYDNNGNTIAENTRQYIYNQNQRLIKVTEGGVTKGEYVYNGNGQRVKKTTTSSGTVIFHYDLQGKIMAESTATGIITADYVFLDGNPYAKIEGNNVYYYHIVHLGTPQKMTNMAGSVVWEAEFLPFGEPLSITGSIVNNLRFPGQYYDSETGLNYNYHRDYHPVIGRYVEADPIGLEAGLNLYVYVRNMPVRAIDPFGLEVCIQWNSYGTWENIDNPWFEDRYKMVMNDLTVSIGTCFWQRMKIQRQGRDVTLRELCCGKSVCAGYYCKIVEMGKTREYQNYETLEKTGKTLAYLLTGGSNAKKPGSACCINPWTGQWVCGFTFQ